MQQKNQTNPSPSDPDEFSGWTFLTNHTHILVSLKRDPEMTVRNLSLQVGITERSVQRILTDLEQSGVVTRMKSGRRNQYSVNEDFRLRHPLEANHTLKDLLEAVK
ncbi:MAG: winged helix-turn-helix domain-containing protein [Verrucomicrobiales bacterium]|nr:winged helix-turn-helix transcriptional regulator [Verrucomicrobiae bacterium]